MVSAGGAHVELTWRADDHSSRLARMYRTLLCSEAFITFISKPHDDDGSNSCALQALDRRLTPEKYPLIDEALLRRLDEQAASFATLKRDAAINTEMISLFVRYFLT